MAYTPLHISKMETGLVQSRQEFLLPNDAYPTLNNAYVWRERIKRKQGYQLLGRLRRTFLSLSLGNSQASPWTFIIYSTLIPPITPEANAEIQLGSVVITIGAIVFTDQGNGTLTSPTVGNSGTINYVTGSVTLTHTAGAGVATTINFNYYPALPVMGLRSRELNNINNEMMIAFDQVYAYRFGSSGFQEFIPGTTWSGTDSNFFWSTNYWVGTGNLKIFWVTNFSGPAGDPIRYTNGINWANFNPIINAANDRLEQCLAMLPFRGRMVTFNTWEGQTLGTSVNFPNRIRWSAIGNPFTTADAIVSVVSADAWRDDIRGKGGFLNIPTSEDIVSVGFVRDNLVIYCESSTWQLKYTGRSIAPFQIEKVNSELGVKATFSQVQFDTSLVGVGDKGVVECDSYKSDRIDIKIPDLVFYFSNKNNGGIRVHGIRNFQQKLAFWIYPYSADDDDAVPVIYPNKRLIYNYENDSWAIFDDSLTCLGTFQSQISRTWASSKFKWRKANFPWVNRPALFPSIVGGNQQGYVEYLDQQTINDVSLSITNIIGNNPNVTQIKVVNHNLQTGQIVQISGIIPTTNYSGLNGVNFFVVRKDADNLYLYNYNPISGQWDIPQVDDFSTYAGGGQLAIRDNFNIVSKKFNFMEEGQKIQIGYIDILMDTTDSGAISLNMYIDYQDSFVSNTSPQNSVEGTNLPDTVFNSVVPTSASALGVPESTKNWQRVFCPTRANFLTVEWTLNNAQMNGVACESDVQIDSQIIYLRPAGRIGI